MAFDRLIDKIAEMQNPTVAGLDPKLDYVPESIKEECFAKYGKTLEGCLLYTSPSPRDGLLSRMPSSA